MKITLNTSIKLIAFLTVCSLFTPLFTQSASAVTKADWNASRIIDDSIFFNPHSMSVQEIQNFLNAKVPTCDTNGEKMYNSTQTRAQWAQANNRPLPPYVCLKQYVQNIPGVAPDAYCGGSVGAGTKSAATIIKEVALACNINPQVILVTLQKEQGLITDDWPWPVQYTKATGMGCPDTSLSPDVDANQNGCYDDYEGFFKQIYYGARQFQRYVKQPDYFNYAIGRNSYIAYQANAPGCGGTYITPQTQATAALYNYTPYQPNGAALDNMYGTGDACSAYGNRNFWRMYNDWFGSTVRPNGDIMISGAMSVSDTSPKAGQKLTIGYTVQNRGSATIDTGVLWICLDMNGELFGAGSNRKVLAPNETLTMTTTFTPQESGTLKLKACGNLPHGPGYVEGYPYALYHDHRERWDWVNNNPMLIVGAISASNSTPLAGETVTMAYAVRNKDTVNFDTGVLWLCGSINGKEFGGGSNRKVLAPGETLTVSMAYKVPEAGTLNIRACGNLPGGPGWVKNYPYGAYPDHSNRTYPVSGQALRIAGAIHISDDTPAVNQPLTISYAVKNYSLSNLDTGVLWLCGSINGKEFGGGSNRKVLAPGEVLTITMPYTPTETGTLTVTACGNTPGGPGWVEGYPYGEYFDHRQRSYSVTN